jgi:CheY-like chemotaxis protein
MKKPALRPESQPGENPGSCYNPNGEAESPSLEPTTVFRPNPDPATGPYMPGATTDFVLGPGPGLPAALLNHPRYHVLGLIGAGGMGAVYKAEHRLMGRLVAIKVVHPSLLRQPVAGERFRREILAAARLSHPNIVAAYDAEVVGDTCFLVMEYVEGIGLDRYLAERGVLPVPEACDYARQVAWGLQHAYERGTVHRDVKPHNLMRTPTGQVKILDFGLARFVSETGDEPSIPRSAPGPARTPDRGLTHPYLCMGTADYLAPEEAANARRADIRADIYGLGCTLYHFLAGRVPFPARTLQDKLRAHQDYEPVALTRLRPEVPERLAAVVARMMAKDPARRYQTPAEVARALAPFAAADGGRVLVVDDEPLNRTAMARVLEAEGYMVSTAANGQEALDRLREGPVPALILLDLVMPVMDGWEFLRRRHEEPGLASIPVVVISATSEAHAEVLALGAADYLSKPVDPNQVAGVVHSHATHRKRAG